MNEQTNERLLPVPWTQMSLRAWAPALRPLRESPGKQGVAPLSSPACPALRAVRLTSTQTAVLLMRQLRTSEVMPLSTSSDSLCLEPSTCRTHSLQRGQWPARRGGRLSSRQAEPLWSGRDAPGRSNVSGPLLLARGCH